MATLAEQYKAAAIARRVAIAATEKVAAENAINALAAQVQTLITSEGSYFIHINNAGVTINTYKAIISIWGQKYLKSLGFWIDIQPSHAVIWWADPIQAAKEIEEIINPPPPAILQIG